ncbi:MAG: site-2 protease family protein [Candidatus Altiarchaeota archaeon]
MRWSYPVFRVMGISVELHLTFILFFLLFLMAGLSNFIFIFLIFSIVLAHELVHSITAKLSGIPVPKITLLPIGGLATIELPENPVLELKISIAGPLFNFFMAGVAFSVIAASGVDLVSYGSMVSSLEEGSLVMNFQHIFSLLVWINLLLGAFNMMPAFPMDGGRVFRSVIALWVEYFTATRIALAVGQGIFLLFVAAGIIWGNIWWIVIGLFLFTVGPNELKFVGLRKAVRGVKVGEMAVRDVDYVNSTISVGEFFRLVARPGQRFYPVIDYNGVMRGVLDMEAVRGVGGGDIGGRVSDYVSREYAVLDASDGVEENLRVLLTSDLVLVTESGRLVGLITPESFSRATSFYGTMHRVFGDALNR